LFLLRPFLLGEQEGVLALQTMDELIEFRVISLKLLELIDFALELSNEGVLLLALGLGGQVRLCGWLRVVQVFAEHNGYNLIYYNHLVNSKNKQLDTSLGILSDCSIQDGQLMALISSRS